MKLPLNIFHFFLSVCLILISGCTPRSSVYTAGITPLSSINHWQVKARVAIRTEEESVSATLDWKQAARDFDFHIYGMFGATYAHLIQEGHSATLKLPEEKIFNHRDAQVLLDEILGWDFPIDALSYWIKGLPSGMKNESIKRDEEQHLASAELNGWRVDFSRYQTYSGYQMPKIIKASHPQLTLKIVVKDWEFLPEGKL
ncbi:lipoprotein insertase outer membrane protein LolB [Aliikangiella sp. G2MR2-5]|uniref:lipoprotein insertase outer membrane protein LolB n=1 Tax=Aliikangiella sp. G2MR2-5 TaxID=2788943 RepID=UPI0018A997AB|nr:lipoprotein insertase outer membrane protein LolB [Aliikangiella sp. G2MR2-5]